jgi:hypothetical protein
MRSEADEGRRALKTSQTMRAATETIATTPVTRDDKGVNAFTASMAVALV